MKMLSHVLIIQILEINLLCESKYEHSLLITSVSGVNILEFPQR